MKKTIILLKITLVLSVLLTGFTVKAYTGFNSRVVNAIFGTPPTSISGPSSVCAGVRATLTAVGGTLSTNDIYQWGTGNTIGSNIISGQTNASLSVTPLVTTTYWVRIIGTSSSTTGVTKVVTVVNPSTAPTSITGNLNTCIGNGTVLTATGATLSSGAVYQWGKGTEIGSNIISGQSGSTLSVTPQSTTTYWVRCVDSGVCTNNSSAASATVSVNTLNDDESAFGNGNWIGYVYPGYSSTANPPTDVFETGYKGFVTTSGINFDTNLGSGPISGPNLCGTYSDYFGVKYKTKLSLTAGYYNFTVGGDDGYRLRIVNSSSTSDSDTDNIVINGWNDQVYTIQSKTIYLSAGTYNLTLEYYEKTGLSRVSFFYTPCSAPSTAPTSISGVTTICNGSSTTLTAVGANLNPGATYQWGNSPTIGNNILVGQTGPSITVSPIGTTTYWVRAIDAAPCTNMSSGITSVITVVSPSTAPTTISGNTTVCLGSSTVLTATGGNSATGVTYQWGTGSVVGSNIITGQNSANITVAPTSDTTYWVQKVDNATCTSSTSGITTSVSVTVPSGDQTSYGTNSWIGYVYSNHNTVSNPVTEDVFATNYRGFITQNETFDQTFPSCVISDANVCGTYNVKYAIRFKMNKTFSPGYYNFLIGGDDGVRLSVDGGATFIINKWNVQAYTTGSATVYLNGNTNLVLEYFQGPLSGARVSFNYTTCSTSTAPTAIAGTTSTCSGSSTTLTATGGFEGVGSTYQWGTGSVVGSNIISGQTTVSITVSPTSTTTYWVRRIDAAPCSLITSGITTTVTTTPKSTAPTWTSGTASVCLGYGTTLSANGGTAATGCTYQWGTGNVIGVNPIAGQTAQTITVSPTSTTTYWVRRLDNGVCSAYTDGIYVTVSVVIPPGDPNAFGNNQWNVYGYSTGDITLATAIYAGNYSINSLNFDTQTGTNSWANTSSPSASAGWVGCTVPNDNFTFVLKRKGFPCGNYTLKLLNWDDEARVYINGTQVWFSNTWSGSSSTTAGATIGNYTLDSNSTIEVRVREYNGLSNAALTFTNNNTFVPSTDPTAISGTTTICGGSSTTLTATGGTLSSSGYYQWGTGSTIGTNVIAGQNAASISVNPTVDSTYWVRRVDSACSNITGGVTQTVTVNTSIGGTLSANQNICSGTSASDIILTGNVGAVVKWQKSSDAAFSNATDIANTTNTLSSSIIGTLTTTTYYRAVVSNASCASAFSTVSSIIVAPASVGGTLTGSARVCSSSNAISLMLGGRVGNIIKWQSSTVSDFSTNVTDIANTTQNLTDSNLTTTTYYRAVVQNGMCSIAYSTTATILVDPVTVAGTVTGSKSYCASNTTNNSVLTLVGKTGSILKWQSSTSSDFSSNVTDIASNSVTLVVSNITTTTYYRALVQSGVCSSAFSTIGSISIDGLSVGGIVSGSSSVCPGSNSTTFTLSGNNGAIQWQSSTNNTTFTNILGATASSYTATNLMTTTYFRATSTNNTCSTANSTTGTVAVNAVSVAGSINGNNRVCSGTNSSIITLIGSNGNIQWQSSTDNNTFTNISGATTTNYIATNLTSTTYYRAMVQNATCSPVYSGVVVITVDAPSVGGTVSGSTTVCTGTNSTTLSLSGFNGAIQWQSSTNNSSYTDINGATSATYTATNLTNSTFFRAVVTNGTCSSANSSLGVIRVSPLALAGNISGSTTVCSGNNNTTLTLNGASGAVQWQVSNDNAIFTNISGANSSTLVTNNLSSTTYYRVVVSNDVCPSVNSSTATISVDAIAVAGIINGATTVCSGTNNTTLTLNGAAGTIQWQVSSDNTTFNNISGANATNLVVSNLTATQYYRAVVSNGVCASVTSASATIAVDAVAVAGTISGATTVCSGTNNTTLTLNGASGSVQWQVSNNNYTFTNILGANASTYVVSNLTATRYYRAVVSNGVCPSVISSSVTIGVDSVTLAGTIIGATTVCSGTNATNLYVSGSVGSVQWQSSTDNTNFSNIVGANLTAYTAANLTATTYYRVVVSNGVCPSVTSNPVTVNVDSKPISGAISGATTVCSGVNSTTLTLSGNSGSSIQWQASTNNNTFTNISGANDTTYVASNLTANKYYRAVVLSGVCPSVATNSVIMNVDIPSVGGTVSGSTRYCLSDNLTTTLTLSSNVGNVVKWQSSTVSNFTSNVQDILNTTTSLSVSNLTATTYFRAVVQNGTCNQAYSSVATITIDALSVGGSIAGSTMVCPNVNSTTLTLNGNLGTVVKWQSSTSSDFSNAVTDITNTTSTLVATNLTVKTYYRAVVANGTCSSANSGIATIDIRPLLGSIGEVSGPTAVCGLSSATYSIVPVANATDYVWTFPSGLSVYSSAGNSVVVNIDGSFRDGTITVKATNGCQVSDTKTIVLTRKPKVSTINGPYSTCGITTGTYVANTIAGATYNWSVPVGINITSGQGTSTIQVSYDSNYVTGTIGLTATTSCGVSDVLEYRVTSIQMPTIINGLAQIGSATTGTYTTPAVPGMGYVWSVPSGVSIVSGQNTNTVNLSFSSTFTMGTITVAMISSCGTSIPRTFDINRSQPIGTIYGSQSLCGIAQITYDTVGTLIDYTNLFATYSVNPVADAIQYVWSVPQGATIVSGQGTNAIVMSFDMTTFINGNVTVTTMTQFGTGATKSIPVKRVSGSITGISNVCSLNTATYNIPATVGTNFTWTVPSFMTIVSGQGTNTISVSVGTPFANDNVKVNFVSNCGTNESFLLNVGCNKSTNVKDSQCGTTLINLDSSIYPNPVAGAQSYKYQVTNGTNVRIYEPTTTLFNLTQLPGGATYNTTYSVQVAVKINGVWGGFGSACDITTPSPITKVKAQFCGTTLTTINTSIYADALIGAQGYRFEVTDANNLVRTFDSTTNLFNLSQLPGTVSYYATYSIRVAANVNGVWGAYGVSCNVSTPGVALTKVADTQCGTTLINLNTSVYYVPVYAAQAYRFEVTNGTSVVTYDLTNTANLFNLTQITGGAAYSTTYSIRVASQVNGVWSAYGTACSITTPAAITKVKAAMCGTTLATISTSVYADALIGVQGYRFEVTDPSNVVRTYDATLNLFNLTQLAGGANYATTYSIRVAAKVNGVWGAYGASCTITTPTQTTAKGIVKEESTEEPIAFTAKGYPNPFNNNFNIAVTSNNKQDIEITVYDMVGKMLTKKVVTNEDLNNTSIGDEFPAGVYNVIVTQGSDVKTLRMIKR